MPFKSSMNQFYTRVLFYEVWVTMPEKDRVIQPVFSLNEDRDGLINCRKTFLELEDPTGYLWSQQYLGSYEHWEKLMRAPWFQEAYQSWLEELKMKIKVRALKKIKEIASGDIEGTPQATVLAAARYLADAGYEAKPGRGRPSKEDLKGELKRQAQILSEEEKDLQRIGGLQVIQGGRK
jgi:hypothetical protein